MTCSSLFGVFFDVQFMSIDVSQTIVWAIPAEGLNFGSYPGVFLYNISFVETSTTKTFCRCEWFGGLHLKHRVGFGKRFGSSSADTELRCLVLGLQGAFWATFFRRIVQPMKLPCSLGPTCQLQLAFIATRVRFKDRLCRR